MQIREELPTDIEPIRAVNLASFETSTEADLADLLRDEASPIVSLVAEDAGAIVGHIMFSPVTGSSGITRLLMGLAPMAVVPESLARRENGGVRL